MVRVFTTADIGKLIRTKRKQLGITQKDLAFSSGVGIRFISELERGKPTVEFDKVLIVIHMLALNLYIGDR